VKEIFMSQDTKENNQFPGFPYTSSEISAYLFTANTFILSLKNGRVEHFITEDIIGFQNWLQAHKIRDISSSAIYSELEN
jgi:hypothetical protein